MYKGIAWLLVGLFLVYAVHPLAVYTSGTLRIVGIVAFVVFALVALNGVAMIGGYDGSS